MSEIESIRTRKEKIEAIAKKYGIFDIRVFGSAITDKPDPHDIDFLVNIQDDKSLLDLVGFQQEVDQLFRRDVDVVLEKSLHWYIKDKILKEAQKL